MLKVKNLTKSFKSGLALSKEKPVLKDVSFSLSEGTVTGFAGANGSGKTTTLQCLLSLIPPDSGSALFFNDLPLTPAVLKDIGFSPEEPCFYDYLTGEELLLFYGGFYSGLKRADCKSRARALLKRLDMYEAKDQHIKTYSKGMLQKIGLAQALVHNPKLVILDEPMAGLDPDGRKCVGELIRERVMSAGVTFFFSSHLFYDMQALCRDMVVLKTGKVVYEGSVQKLLARLKNRIKIVYLEKDLKRSVFADTVEECQKEIDRLRKKGCAILSVYSDSNSLETAFKRIME